MDMKLFLVFIQIGDLFRGQFNLRGLFHLFLFFLMGAIVVGIGVLMITKAFKQKDK
jgi:hypothetical protein